MGIMKYYEMTCEHCQNADYGNFSIKEAHATYRSHGGLITKDGKYFCDKNCYKAYKEGV